MTFIKDANKISHDSGLVCSLLSLISILSWTDLFFEKKSYNSISTIKLNSLYIILSSAIFKNFVIQIILEFKKGFDVNTLQSVETTDNKFLLNAYLFKFRYYYFQYSSGYYYNSFSSKHDTEINMLAIDSLINIAKW